jgi:ankyrin repeat protein
LAQGAEINRQLEGDGTALITASQTGQLDVVRYLISQKAEVDQQVPGDGTALINAVKNGHYATAKLLLENGADPYHNVPGDEYAMYHARIAKNKEMIDLLNQYAKEK